MSYDQREQSRISPTWLLRCASQPTAPAPKDHLLCILLAIYAVASIVFVGGSITEHGGQNMIEPAAYGVAVSFGPKTHNFRDVVRLMFAREAAVVVRDGDELSAFVHACLQDAATMTLLGARSQKLVSEQLGATDKTIAVLGKLLPAGVDDRRAA